MEVDCWLWPPLKVTALRKVVPFQDFRTVTRMLMHLCFVLFCSFSPSS